MAKLINWNTSAIEVECINASMDRLEAAAYIIRDDARSILRGKLKGNWKEHGPYKTYRNKKQHKFMAYSGGEGSIWTARTHGAMIKSIRVSRLKDSAARNIWIMAGDFKTWWAVQLEYGRGKWQGKAKSFLRPALSNAPSKIRGVLEGGATGREVT